MHTNEHLFPHRLTRRDFLKATGVATAALALPKMSSAQETKAPVRLGTGKFTYTLDDEWGKLPEGMKYGFGCGIEVDSRDRIYVTSRSANPAVAVFDRNGKLLETWGKDFADKVGYTEQQVVDSAHCIYRSQEKDGGKDVHWYA